MNHRTHTTAILAAASSVGLLASASAESTTAPEQPHETDGLVIRSEVQDVSALHDMSDQGLATTQSGQDFGDNDMTTVGHEHVDEDSVRAETSAIHGSSVGNDMRLGHADVSHVTGDAAMNQVSAYGREAGQDAAPIGFGRRRA